MSIHQTAEEWPEFRRKMVPVWEALRRLKEFLDDFPLEEDVDWENGLVSCPWPDEMKQLIANYIIAAEPIIRVWQSINVRTRRGLDLEPPPPKGSDLDKFYARIDALFEFHPETEGGGLKKKEQGAGQ